MSGIIFIIFAIINIVVIVRLRCSEIVVDRLKWDIWPLQKNEGWFFSFKIWESCGQNSFPCARTNSQDKKFIYSFFLNNDKLKNFEPSYDSIVYYNGILIRLFEKGKKWFSAFWNSWKQLSISKYIFHFSVFSRTRSLLYNQLTSPYISFSEAAKMTRHLRGLKYSQKYQFSFGFKCWNLWLSWYKSSPQLAKTWC